jgi:poly(A) polymerase
LSVARQKVVLLLEQTLPNFGRVVAKERDYKKGPIAMKLSKFGSFALGGYIRNADIDLVLLCPFVVRRFDFNKILPELLRQQATIQDVNV